MRRWDLRRARSTSAMLASTPGPTSTWLGCIGRATVGTQACPARVAYGRLL